MGHPQLDPLVDCPHAPDLDRDLLPVLVLDDEGLQRTVLDRGLHHPDELAEVVDDVEPAKEVAPAPADDDLVQDATDELPAQDQFLAQAQVLLVRVLYVSDLHAVRVDDGLADEGQAIRGGHPLSQGPLGLNLDEGQNLT